MESRSTETASVCNRPSGLDFGSFFLENGVWTAPISVAVLFLENLRPLPRHTNFLFVCLGQLEIFLYQNAAAGTLR